MTASGSERCSSVPTVNSPSRSVRRWLAKCRRSQIASSNAALRGRVDRARDPQLGLGAALGHPDGALAFGQRRQIGVGEPRAHGELGVEVRGISAVAGHERDDDVGPATLGTDERLGVGLAPVELGQDLVGGVAAPAAVALHLPAPAQVLRRVQEDPHVIGVAHRRGVEAEHPLDDRELGRGDVLGRRQRSVAVAVDGLEDRLAGAQVDEVLLEDVQVVGVGVQRRQPLLGALGPRVAVIVVAVDVRDPRLAEDAHEPARQRRLAGGGVAADSEKDRPWHRGRRA